MRRYLMPSIAVAVAVALLALLAYGINNQGENLSIDSQIAHGHDPVAPSAHDALDMLGSSGKADLADFRGQVVVMNIFASWCTDCVGESPVLEQAQQMLKGHGGTVLGVTYLDNSIDARQFVTAHHLTYPVIEDVNGNLVRSYGTDAVPETFVIDRAGRVAAAMRSVVSSQWLAQAISRAEKQSSA
ncbi:MAG TPA: TlpA disulfide reductase family protein [Solirubrobacteraceae bacterium]|jgi:cytochrome c biogenesis protein CcmG/thiol:disulfide interchange protein DsbE|nr:TlpA disulfide reductase family protein [Solirubrobacteraceae bacterium]